MEIFCSEIKSFCQLNFLYINTDHFSFWITFIGQSTFMFSRLISHHFSWPTFMLCIYLSSWDHPVALPIWSTKTNFDCSCSCFIRCDVYTFGKNWFAVFFRLFVVLLFFITHWNVFFILHLFSSTKKTSNLFWYFFVLYNAEYIKLTLLYIVIISYYYINLSQSTFPNPRINTKCKVMASNKICLIFIYNIYLTDKILLLSVTEIR